MIMLWAAASYMVKVNKNHWICSIPAVFMSAVTSAYILQAPEGFRISASVSNIVGIIFALVLFGVFLNYTRKSQKEDSLEFNK